MGVESAGADPGRGFAGTFSNCGWKIQVPVDLWICQGSGDVQKPAQNGVSGVWSGVNVCASDSQS